MFPNKVNILKLSDPHFPDQLKHIDPALKQIFWAGRDPSEWIALPKVAIVGSRKASAYGRTVTTRLSSELAGQGVVIVSGLALGIDSIAHQSALNAGGCTVAILPTALSDIYPASHYGLAVQITEQGGTIITEYSPEDVIYKENFIARNRIVSGLADVLLITEAALNSGTMHTARFALEQGKTVMSVPGNINQPGSEGCNNLIKSGAIPVTTSDDVFFALGVKPDRRSAKSKEGLSRSQKIILELIAAGYSDQEDLALSAKLTGPQLASALTGLELAGVVRPQGAGRWMLS